MALCCCGVKWQRDLFCFSPRFRLARRSWIGMSVLSSGTGGSFFFFFSSRRRHTRWTGDWSSDVCSSDLLLLAGAIVVMLPVLVLFLFLQRYFVQGVAGTGLR